MNGSDAERMLAEIEAFLRTGEAPPPAPEPVRVAPPPRGPRSVPPPPTARTRPRRRPVENLGQSGDRLAPGPDGPGDRRGKWRVGRLPGFRGGAGGVGGGGFGRDGLDRDGLGRGGFGRGGFGRGGFGRGGFGRGGFGRRGVGRSGRVRGSGVFRAASHRAAYGSGSFGSSDSFGPGGLDRRFSEPPRWSPLRILAVVLAILGLALLPYLYPSHQNAATTGVLDRASAAPAGPGYGFYKVNASGTPVRWNPCSIIYYQTNFKDAPPWALSDLQTAILKLYDATGLQFVDDGTTQDMPLGGYQPRVGDRANPIVFAWANANQSQQIPTGDSRAESLGVVQRVMAWDQAQTHAVYVSGLVIESAQAAQLPEGMAPGGLGILFMQQLGKLVGLDRIDDPAQVMSPQVLSSGLQGYGPGDLAGLKRLGLESGCLKVPAGMGMGV